ncbi:hypothetical protein V6Z12_D07G252800 [Gossypium hirsutum]
MRIHSGHNLSGFLCSAVCTSPQPTKRMLFWHYLCSLACLINKPLVIADLGCCGSQFTWSRGGYLNGWIN